MDTEKNYFIKSIRTKRKVTNEDVTIILDGSNLIITGDNGCGKTKLVEGIYEVLNTTIISTGDNTVESLQKTFEKQQRELDNFRPGDSLFSYHKRRNEETKIKLESLMEIHVSLNEIREFKESFHTRNAFIKYFEARRFYVSEEKTTISSINSFIKDYIAYPAEKNEEKAQLFFENYVSSLVNYGMLSNAKGNKEESERVDKWFKKIQEDLRVLFEDDSIRLSFDIENLTLKIEQKNKEPYGLSQLSSGYSSILAIYAELLMCVELNKLPMQELQGIVIIDEIDAHLHVSLQKVIFAFFRKAFPQIQFIITTHSPFVVQSVNDAVIYDLSKLEQLNDLSMYSYESITKGLLGESSNSNLLENVLCELEMNLNSSPIDKNNLRSVLDKMLPFKEKMHHRARVFYKIGINKLIELELEEE